MWRYVLLHWPWRWGLHFHREFQRAPASIRRRAWREFALFALLWSIPFFIDVWMAIGLWAFPAWFGSTVIMGQGMYTQHAGGTNDRRFSQTTTFLSHFGNLTMFNAGFHIEHHAFPTTHWSELPRLHERMKAELIAGGAHVVPFGLYRGTALLNSLRSARGWQQFMEQHPDYRSPDRERRAGASPCAEAGGPECQNESERGALAAATSVDSA
jgi:fatty acid desaturase